MLLNKVLAVYVGPTGYVAIGQFQRLVTMLTTFASGGINTGVIKLTAQHNSEAERHIAIWRTAGSITATASILVGLAIFAFRSQLANLLLRNADLSFVFIWLGASVLFLGFNGLLLAVLNGLKDVNRLVTVNITGAIFGLAVTIVAVRLWGLSGALVGVCINQALLVVATIILCKRLPWLRIKNFFGSIDFQIARELGAFALMAATSAAVAPLVQIAVRSYAIDQFGTAHAGYWEAMQRISSTYLGLVTTTLAVYFLPRIAELSTGAEIRQEIKTTGRIVLPIVCFISILLFLARDWTISLLFTHDFHQMRDLFPWQLIGDVLKIGSWLYAYVLVGRAMSLPYILCELWFGAQLYVLSRVFGGLFGFEGLTIAHAINYFTYLVAMYLMFNMKFPTEDIAEHSQHPGT